VPHKPKGIEAKQRSTFNAGANIAKQYKQHFLEKTV
jgi:hypothetical protein